MRGREQQAETSAGIDCALHFDPPLMLLHDAEDRGQSEPGPLSGFFGREKRFENPLQVFGWDATACIAHAEYDELTRSRLRMPTRGSVLDADRLRADHKHAPV